MKPSSDLDGNCAAITTRSQCAALKWLKTHAGLRCALCVAAVSNARGTLSTTQAAATDRLLWLRFSTQALFSDRQTRRIKSRRRFDGKDVWVRMRSSRCAALPAKTGQTMQCLIVALQTAHYAHSRFLVTLLTCNQVAYQLTYSAGCSRSIYGYYAVLFSCKSSTLQCFSCQCSVRFITPRDRTSPQRWA